MTKIFLKISCRDSNPPGLAENCPFLENISSHPFSLNILPFLTFLSQRARMFSLFNQSFSTILLAVFTCFSVVSQPFCPFALLIFQRKTVVVLVAEMDWIASTLCKVCIHSWHAPMALDFFVVILFIQ